MQNKGFWKIGFFVTLLLLLLVIGFSAFLMGKGDISFKNLNLSKTPTATEEPLETISSTPNVQIEVEAIKNAVFEKTGLTNENADVTVNDFSSNHAKGGIKEKEAISGAYFIAAKVDNKWVCVYDGQSYPTCEQIESYNFPTEMVPECLGFGNNIIER